MAERVQESRFLREKVGVIDTPWYGRLGAQGAPASTCNSNQVIGPRRYVGLVTGWWAEAWRAAHRGRESVCTSVRLLVLKTAVLALFLRPQIEEGSLVRHTERGASV